MASWLVQHDKQSTDSVEDFLPLAHKLAIQNLSAVSLNENSNYLLIIQTSIFLAQQTPFTVGFISDADEITTTAAAIMATQNELSGIPGGIHGFMIDFVQIPC